MQDGLAITFETLQRSGNRSTREVLEAAFREGDAEVRGLALTCMIESSWSSLGGSVVAHWHELPEELQEQILKSSATFSGALRHGLQSDCRRTIDNALEIIEQAREPSLAPELVRIVERKDVAFRPQAARALESLVRSLAEEGLGWRQAGRVRSRRTTREQVYQCLQKSMQRFADHQAEEVAAAFLLLAEPRDELLRRCLRNPREPAMPVLTRILAEAQDPLLLAGVLVESLTVGGASPGLLRIWSHRNDLPFVQAFCHRVGRYPSETIRGNLRRMKSVRWLRGNLSHLAQLSPTEQIAVLQLARIGNVSSNDVFRVVEFLILHGELEVQQRATELLQQIETPAANRLVARLVEHPDPTIRAAVIGQVRERRIPGAMEILLHALDSEDPPVRAAARRCFPDVSLDRYLSSFDQMASDVRLSMGRLVMKVDREAVEKIEREVREGTRNRRLRGLHVVETLELTGDLESAIVQCLQDDDYFVRMTATSLLGNCRTSEARKALREALMDPSKAVRDEAEKTLQGLARIPLYE